MSDPDSVRGGSVEPPPAGESETASRDAGGGGAGVSTENLNDELEVASQTADASPDTETSPAPAPEPEPAPAPGPQRDVPQMPASLWRYLPVVGALAAFCCYLVPIKGVVLWGDSGEIAAAAAKLGVMHPTGYPLYILLGHLFTWLPLPFEAAGKLSVFSAVCSTVTVYVLARAGAELAARVAPKRREDGSLPDASALSVVTSAHVVGATFVAMGFGLSPIFFSQSVIIEVYALHAMLISLTGWCLVRFEVTRDRRWIRLSALTMGLGLTNHMTTAHLMPGVFLFVLVRDWRFFFSKYALQGLLIGLLCLGLYGYLPLADRLTEGHPWGGTSDSFAAFFFHVSAKQYHNYVFGSAEMTRDHLNAFPKVAYENLWSLSLGLLYGLYALVRGRAAIPMFFVVAAGLGITHAIGYSVSDYQVFFCAPFTVLALWAASGMSAFTQNASVWLSGRRFFAAVPRRRLIAGGVMAAALFAAPVVEGAILAEHHRTDPPNADAYARELLSEIPPGSLLVVSGDGTVFTLQYYQFVKKFGTDVALVNARRFKNEWWIRHAKKLWPWLELKQGPSKVRAVHDTIKAYAGKRRIFERHVFDDKFAPPKGFRVVCRGQYNEIVKGKRGQLLLPVLNYVSLSGAPRRALYRKYFTRDEFVYVNPRWRNKPKGPYTIEWVNSRGKVRKSVTVNPGDAKAERSAFKLDLHRKRLGKWMLRGTADGEVFLEAPFTIVDELPEFARWQP